MATPLTELQKAALADDIPAWAVDGEHLTRTFRFPGFAEAMGFVTSVALVAEAADHHPDIAISWNTVTLTLSTHSANALTHLDRDLAVVIDGLV
ncbi:MAG: 4a-hydroxytetrahydrobiopterin dehydratase [Acidimicrobiia bacterium]|nr:4a-hydroxytetrahydrobiopterin dehydratase [Acidimicrobiia bacterium]